MTIDQIIADKALKAHLGGAHRGGVVDPACVRCRVSLMAIGLAEGADSTYSARVRELEAEGLTTSDAQSVADAELMPGAELEAEASISAHELDEAELGRFDIIEGVRPPKVLDAAGFTVPHPAGAILGEPALMCAECGAIGHHTAKCSASAKVVTTMELI